MSCKFSASLHVSPSLYLFSKKLKNKSIYDSIIFNSLDQISNTFSLSGGSKIETSKIINYDQISMTIFLNNLTVTTKPEIEKLIN